MFLTEIKKIQNNELLVTSAFILLCLALFLFFPSQGAFQGLSKGLFFLVVIPALYIKFILKKTLSSFGLNTENMVSGIIWGFPMFLVLFFLFYSLIEFTGFRNGYVLPDYVIHNFWLFLVYELIFVNFLFFLYSCFFQGFILFYFYHKLSYWVIPLQTALFSLLLFLNGGINWQSSPFMIFSLAGGLITYKTKSFVYAYISGIIFSIILDSYLIYTLKIK